MRQTVRTLKQRVGQQQRRVVLLVLALALFGSTLFALQHSLAQNSALPGRHKSKSAAKSRARAQSSDEFPTDGWVGGGERDFSALRRFTFAATTTTKIRVTITNARNNWSRLVEVEAWGCPAS